MDDIPLRAKTGDFRFDMLDPQGRRQGASLLRIAPRERGGLRVEWELRFDPDKHGGYREERTHELDAQWRLASASYGAMGKPVAKARRDAGRLVGEHFPAGELIPRTIDLALRDDACTGMKFVLAMFLPLDMGEEAWLERWHYDEAAAFQPAGVASTIHYVCEDDITIARRTTLAHRFMVEDEHSMLPVWVNERHELVQADWGGGNLMVPAAAAPVQGRVAPAKPARAGTERAGPVRERPTRRTKRRTRRIGRPQS